MNNMSEFIKASDLYKTYKIGRTTIPVISGVDLSVEKGEWIALLGASGSGKTTLLNLIGALERPDSGNISYNGRDYSSFGRRKIVQFRCARIGFIFQAYHMFPELTVLENVLLPAMFNGSWEKKMKDRAGELLESVGLGHRIKHRPNELSGGEQQRAAIARALINSPEFILADEPTGNLDSKTGSGILEIFQKLHGSSSASTIIMVTHDRNVAKLATRTVELIDGKICPSE